MTPAEARAHDAVNAALVAAVQAAIDSAPPQCPVCTNPPHAGPCAYDPWAVTHG